LLLGIGFLGAELEFPAEDAGLVAGFFGFGDHAFALVGAGDGGPGENVVGVESEDAAGGVDGAVEVLFGVVGLGEGVEGVGEVGVERESELVLGDGFVELGGAEEVDAGVVVVFGGHWGGVYHCEGNAGRGGAGAAGARGNCGEGANRAECWAC